MIIEILLVLFVCRKLSALNYLQKDYYQFFLLITDFFDYDNEVYSGAPTLVSNFNLLRLLSHTMRKLYLSIKLPHQEIMWNYGILRSVTYLSGTTPFEFVKIYLADITCSNLTTETPAQCVKCVWKLAMKTPERGQWNRSGVFFC